MSPTPAFGGGLWNRRPLAMGAALALAASAMVACGTKAVGRAASSTPSTTAVRGAVAARQPAPVPRAPDGPLPVPPSLDGAQWSSLPTTAREVALTFDCGSNDAAVPTILAALAASGATATFTLTGVFAETYPAVARRIAADGFDIADHTYNHLDMTRMSLSAARAEVTRGAAIIERITGRNPRPLFRFPFGAFDGQLIRLVNGLGYGSFLWTVDTLGWEGTVPTATSSGGQSVASVERRVLRALTPGEIVLMHCGAAPDGTTLDADALATVVRAIERRGYHFVTLHGYLKTLGSRRPTGSSSKYLPS